MVKNPPANAGDLRHGFDPWVRKIHWRRKWQPTLAFFPRKLNGQRSLEGYSPWSHKESDTTEQFSTHVCKVWSSLVAQMVKCLPATRKTWVRPLGWEDPLEKEMATHSSTLAWKIPWTKEPGRLQSMGAQRVCHD